MAYTELILRYDAYVTVKIPNAVADRMKSGELEWHNRWACVEYDDNGMDVRIEGNPDDVDYKRAISHEWVDNTREKELAAWQDYLKNRRKPTPMQEDAPELIVTELQDAVPNQENTEHRDVSCDKQRDKASSSQEHDEGESGGNGPAPGIKGEEMMAETDCVLR